MFKGINKNISLGVVLTAMLIMPLVLVLTMVLSSCAPAVSDSDSVPTGIISQGQIPMSSQEKTVSIYIITKVEGMSCIIIKDRQTSLGVSCDWDEWDGNK